jgi:hypothetical protein
MGKFYKDFFLRAFEVVALKKLNLELIRFSFKGT